MTSRIVAGLVIGFIVFITVQGQLPTYIGIFTGSAAPPAAS